MTKMYELYYCMHNGEVVYIGQGAKGRHAHCNSGCSHVYSLNEIHFKEGVDALETKVIMFGRDKEEMVRLEKEHILALKPKFNSQYLKRRVEDPQAVIESMNMKKALLEYPRTHGGKKGTEPYVQKYEKLCNEFFEFHSTQNIIDKDIVLYKRSSYHKYGAKYLANLLKNIKYRDKLSGYCIMFCDAMLELFDVDLKSPEYHIKDNGARIVASVSLKDFPE